MKRVLHVGCSDSLLTDRHPHFQPEEWAEVRLDSDPQCDPNIVANITNMPAVPSGSFDAVFSYHGLERLYAHEALSALREFRRVLNANGFALILTPDLKAAAAAIVSGGAEMTLYDSPAGPITPLDMIYGHRASVSAGGEVMAHRTGFTSETMFRLLIRAGFGAAVATRRNTLEVWGIGFVRPLPDAEIEAAKAVLFATPDSA